MLFSLLANIPPMFVSLFYADGMFPAFFNSLLIILGLGAILFLSTARTKKDLGTRDGFLVVTLFWAVLGTAGCLPFLFSPALELSITDAVFESLSGLTTTGATVISGLDSLPKSILFYRQQLQWLGGMGIIVLAISLLPMLGIGGMQLYRAETPGPMKDHKLTPRITSTAKALFTIYLLITIACCASYWLAGMSPFDALSHSFSTVAIGGFSTHDASIGYFDNPFILVVAMAFMLIAGINFALHFFAYHNRSLAVYRQDSEFKFYLLVNLLAVVIVGAALLILNYQPIGQADQLLEAAFQVVSLSTTTGFVVGDYSQWPTFIPLFMFFLAFMGASAGSTGGGMKAIRVLLIIKQGYRELLRLIHPHAVIPIKVAGRPISNDVVSAVWSFFAFYVFAYIAMILMVLATGTDFLTAFSAVGASINNLGPGLGEVSEHYSGLSATAKWTLCLAMLLGRLEVFTVLVLLTPAFWRK